MKVEIKRLEGNDLELPSYETKNSAGMDLRACITENIVLKKGERKLIKTGISIALPENYEAQVRPRSGLALKKGLTVLNTPGTIDTGYRNEWGVIVINNGFETVWIEDKERIAQAVLVKFEKIEWENHSLKDITSIGLNRGGGFGHSNYGKNGEYIK